MDRIAKVQAILRRWDAIGVRPGEDAPADEYDSYAPRIVAMVDEGCSREGLSAHLEALRRNVLGVGADGEADQTIADEILRAIRDPQNERPAGRRTP